MKLFKNLPYCFEKTLITINYYLSLAYANSVDNRISDDIFEAQDFNFEIKKCLEEMKLLYQKEGIDDIRILDGIENLTISNLDSKSYKALAEKYF